MFYPDTMTGVKTIFFQEFANSDIFDSIKTPPHFPTVTRSEEYKQVQHDHST